VKLITFQSPPKPLEPLELNLTGMLYHNQISPAVSEKKMFEISANQNALLALTAMWNLKSAP
jgi:hypothetical protein